MTQDTLPVNRDLEEKVYTAIGHASVCWDDDGVFESEEAKKIGDELITLFKARDDLLYTAWAVIANSPDWLLEEETDWVKAAKAWRDEYHSQLGVEKYVAGPFTTNRAEKRRVQRIVRRVQKVRK